LSLILYIYKYVDGESAVFSLVSVVRRLHEQILIKDNSKLIGESADISLESIISRAFAHRYYGNSLKSHLEFSCYLVEAIIVGHPFLDGNKRTALALLRILEPEFAVFDLLCHDNELEKIIVLIAAKQATHKNLLEYYKLMKKT
jgi:death-on-curing family protein